jgi:hypothetical protein
MALAPKSSKHSSPATYVLHALSNSFPLTDIAAIAQDQGLNKIKPDDVPGSLKSHSQHLTIEEVADLVAQLTQKQQQQEQEDPVLRSIETHDLQEILVGTDRYLRRFGNTDR